MKPGRRSSSSSRLRRRCAQQITDAPRNPARADKFVAHLYQARKQYGLVCERPNKGNKAIEREVISSYQIAQSLGFRGDFRAWEHSLRIHAECAIEGNELLTTRGYENPEVPRRGTLESPLAQELLDLRRRESQCLRMRERLKREFYAAPVVCLAIRWLI
jgi:hypothetical protein